MNPVKNINNFWGRAYSILDEWAIPVLICSLEVAARDEWWDTTDNYPLLVPSALSWDGIVTIEIPDWSKTLMGYNSLRGLNSPTGDYVYYVQ